MQVLTKATEVLILPDGRMDTKNAAIYTGLSERTLRQMRWSGRGPEYVKMGKVFYFKRSLDQWISRGVVQVEKRNED